MWILLMLIMTVAAPADATIEQAFRQNGALGVVSLAKAIEKDEGAAKAVELMSLVLQHEDAELGAAAAHAVGILGDAGKMALPQLATALIGDQAAVISKALNTLGPGDIPIWLAEATLRPNGDTKAYQALVALGLTDERLVPILQEGLGHSDLRRRCSLVLWHGGEAGR